MAGQTMTSIGDLLQACHQHLEAEERAAVADADTITASTHIARSYPTAMTEQEPDISAINVTTRSVKSALHISIYNL